MGRRSLCVFSARRCSDGDLVCDAELVDRAVVRVRDVGEPIVGSTVSLLKSSRLLVRTVELVPQEHEVLPVVQLLGDRGTSA